MPDQELPEKARDEGCPSPDRNTSSATNNSAPADKEAPLLGQKKEEKIVLPSHSTLAFSNYPPLWSPGSNPSPRPKVQKTRESQYTSAESMRAILDTGSSSSKKSGNRFEERDASNNHQYLQEPDRSYTHPRLNIFGRDVGPLGRPPSFSWRRKK